MAEEKRKRILSGIQPTGTPTLGNYIGAVRNWALLQSDYDCLYMVADLHRRARCTSYPGPGCPQTCAAAPVSWPPCCWP